VYREHRQEIRRVLTEGDPARAIAAVLDDSAEVDPALLGFGLVDFLLSLRPGEKGVATLANQLRQKTASERAIQTVYGMDRNSLAVAWAGYAAKRYPAARRR
jgi:hypothetical protein